MGFLALLNIVSVPGCLTPKHESSQVSEPLHQPRVDTKTDFCEVRGSEPRLDDPGFWNGVMVQNALENLISDLKLAGTPWYGYPVAYKKMTARRDEARCRGVLKSDVKGMALINHQLADNMTRWFITITKLCVATQEYLVAQTGVCGRMNAAYRSNATPLESAMAMTAVYISSHLAESLAAVILDDEFWSQYPVLATQMPSGTLDKTQRKQVLGYRIREIKLYKTLFDKFNGLLGGSIPLVADALREKNLLKGPLATIELLFAQLLPCKSLLFGKIRDQAFEVAQLLALDPNQGFNPMMELRDQRYVLNYGHYVFERQPSRALLNLEQSALDAVANPLAMGIYRLMGRGESPSQEQMKGFLGDRCGI